MTTLDSAIKKDIEAASAFYPPYQNLGPRVVVEAAAGYESYLADYGEQEHLVEASINLSNLYWQVLDPGFSQAIDEGFYKKAETRNIEVLDQVLIKCPSEKEVLFWKKYYALINYGADFSEEDCETLLQGQKDLLVPYFFLFSSSGGKKYRDEANELLKSCKTLPTMKNSYIASVIQSSALN